MIKGKQSQWLGQAWLLIIYTLLTLCFVSTGIYAEEAKPAANVPSIPNYSNEQLLNQMLVVDVAERTLDNLPALAITFSQDLQPTVNFASFITLTQNGKAIDGSWVLANEPRRLFFTNIQPQTEYRVQVRPGITSKSALKLEKPADVTLKTRDIQPAFDFATKGSILPAKLTSGLPIRVVNVPELDIEFLRVQPDKLPEVLKSIRTDERLAQWQLDDIHAVTESVHYSRYKTNAQPNARTNLVIPVETMPELQQLGLYFAIMRQPGRFNDSAYRITQFVVTNIGLHVRLYPRGLEVFANALDSGKPLKNVKLTLQGESETLEQTTNEQGQVHFEHKPRGNLLIMAMLEGQFTFLDMRQPALDLSEYAVTGLTDQPIAPFMYSPRDLYRPGEALDLSVLLRDRDGKPVSVEKLQLRLVRPDSKWLLEQTLSVVKPELGYFNYRGTIPSDAPTGSWKAEIRLNAKDELPIASFGFQVEDFMPERMKLTLGTDSKLLTPKDNLVVSAQGDYLYGAPASGNKLTVSRSASIDRHAVADLKDFYFGTPADEKLLTREELPELTLNEQGNTFIKVPFLAGKINSPLILSVVGNLHEMGGRSVRRQVDLPFWPAPNLVGIKPLFANDTAATDSQAEFELARVTREGQAAVPKQALAVTLVREEKEYFWEYNEAEGWQRKELANEFPLAQQKLTLDAQARAKVNFPVKEGYYRLEVEDAETGLKAVYPFHAGWDWQQAENTAARPDQISLALDKPAYKGGDVAKLTITPPSAGEAIVMVESDTLLWSQAVSLSAQSKTLEIPIDSAWNQHNLYITVTSFRPASSQQKIAPNRALGVIYLPLERNDRQLKLSLDAPAKVLPEQTLKVTLKADNIKNEAAMVTLAAVDNGILAMTNFKTPDPFKFYFSQHAYGVNLYDAYGKIIEGMDGKPLQQRFGGDAWVNRSGQLPAVDLKLVSLFSGPVELDNEGKASIEFNLPSFDGSLRLMALAATRDRFGTAEQELKIASPVVASMTGPRFLAAGDNSFITIDLNNTTQETQTVKVNISANQVLDFTPVEKDFTLARGKREALRLPIAARQQFGSGMVNVDIKGKEFSSHRQLPLPVRPAYPGKHVSLNRELSVGAGLLVDKNTVQGFIPASLTATLGLAASPVLPLRSVLNGLWQYPYGCVEQTTSAAWPYLYVDNAASELLGLKPLEMKERNEKIQAAIMRLAGMQLSNGSFTLWPEDGEEEFWLTPYVTDFLLDAQDQGFVVPEWLLQKAIANLQDRLQSSERFADTRFSFSDQPEQLEFAVRAYTSYVLARAKQQVNLMTLRTLFDQNSNKATTSLALIHLALALKLQGDTSGTSAPPRWKQAVDKALTLVRKDDNYMGDYGSDLRDQAASLYLLFKHKIDIPNQAQAINRLMELVQGRDSFSTQEQLYVLLAGLKINDKAKASWKAQVKIGDKLTELNGSGLKTRLLTPEELAQGVQVLSANAQPLYTTITLDGYAETIPTVKVDPIDIQRVWYNAQGKQIQPADIKVGDLLMTHLIITSKEAINDALVTDLVPAGFEVENTNLANTESLTGVQLEGIDKPLDELLSSTYPRYQEYRSDRYVAALALQPRVRNHLFYMVRVVSAGNFSVPPPYVTDMYRPNLQGIGSAPAKISLPMR